MQKPKNIELLMQHFLLYHVEVTKQYFVNKQNLNYVVYSIMFITKILHVFFWKSK